MNDLTESKGRELNFFEKKYAKVSEDQMNNGVEVDFGSGFYVTIRHSSADEVSNARNRKTKQMKLFNRNKDLTPEQNLEVTRYVASHAGIVTWRGGNVPEFSPEFAYHVFIERPEFLEDVLTAMTSYETFRQEEVEEASGN